MQKITVLGGSGFIGTCLCQLLADRQIPFEIIDLVTSEQFPDKTKIADIRDKESLQNTVEGEVVVNLAAVHTDDSDPGAYFETNVLGAKNLAEICAEKGILKIVFTSSVAVYGFAKLGTDETGAINPFNEYGKSKYQAEEAFEEWHAKSPDDRALLVIRPTVVFGEGNRGNVYNLIKQISSGRFVMVGNGENQKSMAYVQNIAAFLLTCITTKTRHGTYNYVDTPDYDMNSLVTDVRKTMLGKENIGPRLPKWAGLILGWVADVVTKFTGRKLPISRIRVKKFTSSTSFATSKGDLDGFEAPFTLQEGLSRTLKSLK
ncbi:NAD-dependent epimerase/dehydratase family protein [Profundibacter sp.]